MVGGDEKRPTVQKRRGRNEGGEGKKKKSLFLKNVEGDPDNEPRLKINGAGPKRGSEMGTRRPSKRNKKFN